ncbi:MAG: VapC toxin family PIN domain ribonuclease [Hydrogenophilaceae bacterium CG1_02_62_390]|nr:type II toxin-antitoxin system VapC family toxin [Betaproteobacteria bacterium]OIO77812.1 MAG: VapC toxin family PIN domain ribonuclease [Hydrogenophilaceae bacterium CG1_02_62_390]PIX02438.1 MAG: VapC toxin family PIN domain ribonuclease [Hydrogenophilales bacterium CG_4_8_14_3_um_filter_62_83]
MNIVDTSGWLEYLADSPFAENYAAAIERTDELLVPSIVLYEVFKKITLAYDENQAFQAIAQLKQGQVLDVDESVALYAGKISLEKKLPMADALIYATAILHHAALLTQDAHFEGLPQVKYFAKTVSDGS